MLPCANTAGTHKCKLFVVGRFKKPRTFKNLVHPPVHYDTSNNAWMTAALFKWWFYHCFVPEVKEHLREQGLPEDSKVILLPDNCRAHLPALELVSRNIFAAFLPPNVTSLIQPMDQGIISNIKHYYKSGFLHKLVNTDLDVPEFQKSFDLEDAIYAAALAWKDVKDSTLHNCWHKLWPTLTTEDFDFEGFDDPDTVSADHVERLHNLASQAPESHPIRNVDSGEMEEWLNLEDSEPTVQELTDEAILSMLRTPTQTAEQKSEGEGEKEERTKVSWKSAQDAFETILSFTESNPY